MSRPTRRRYVPGVVPSTVLQDAVALLTIAMDATDHDELRQLVAEFREKDGSDELMLAVVALCRSLCLVTSKVIHTLDDSLSDAQADALTDDELMPMAMEVVRSYAASAAYRAEDSENNL